MERKGKTKNNSNILIGSSTGSSPLKDRCLDLNGDVDVRCSLDLPGCGLGQVDGCCEHGNKTWTC